MRENIVGLLAAALMAVCGVASANIIYNVDISGAGETITGTITTDGASGLLMAADFVSWSLAVTGPGSFIDNSLEIPNYPQTAVCAVAGCGVTAGGGEGGVAGFLFLLFTGTPPQALMLETHYDVAVDFYYDHIVIPLQVIPPPIPYPLVLLPEVTPYLVGSAPEPPSAILLGIGLACLGLACTRARRR